MEPVLNNKSISKSLLGRGGFYLLGLNESHVENTMARLSELDWQQPPARVHFKIKELQQRADMMPK